MINKKTPRSEREQMTEEVTETSFQRTRIIKGGTLNQPILFRQFGLRHAPYRVEGGGQKHQSKSRDRDVHINYEYADDSFVLTPHRIRKARPGNILELEANSELISPSSVENEIDCDSTKEGTSIVCVDLTADIPEESHPEVKVRGSKSDRKKSQLLLLEKRFSSDRTIWRERRGESVKKRTKAC